MAKITTHIETVDGLNPFTSNTSRPKRVKVKKLARLLQAISAHETKHGVTLKAGTAQAGGTITFASCPAGQVIEVNGVEFIAISGTPTVANNEFDIAGNDTVDAASFVTTFNACTDAKISGLLTATSALGVVTFTATKLGLGGNAFFMRNRGIMANGTITCAAVGTGDTVSINGTALTATQHYARGTATFSTIVADNLFVIGGVIFTAKVSASGLNEFDLGASDTAAAAAAVLKVNAHPALTGIVTATSAAGVVTFRSATSGTGGNSITLTRTGSPISVSGATLSGGAAIGNNEFDFGGSDTQTAAALVTAIGASTTALVSSHVSARNTAGVVTLKSKFTGVAGNAARLVSSNGTRLAVTGSGFLTGGTEASINGTAATGTITISGGSGNYTVTINGVATGNVAFNTSDNQTAADIATAGHAITNILWTEHVKISVATNVVTFTALRAGAAGNAVTVACTGTGATASAARLTGGAVSTIVALSGDRLTGGTESTFTF